MEMHPGEALFIPIIGLHRDPSYYPDPERFDPERFSDDNKHNINPLTYLPFGIGPRICIGEYNFKITPCLSCIQLTTVIRHFLT
jgi:cytochrome P450 family 9